MIFWKLRVNGMFWIGYTSGKIDKNGKEFKSLESLHQSLNRLKEAKPDLYDLLTCEAEIVKFELKEIEIIPLNENTTDPF